MRSRPMPRFGCTSHGVLCLLWLHMRSVLNKIHNTVLPAIENMSGLKGVIARHALAVKMDNLRRNVNRHWLWDKLVFSVVKQKIGFDNIRVIVSGSAPLGSHVMDLMRVITGCVPLRRSWALSVFSTVVCALLSL